MRIRARLLLVSVASLGLGLAVLIVLGNVLLANTVDGLTSRLLTGRADAEIAGLSISPAGVSARRSINDEQLDANAWIFSRGRLRERPLGVLPALDRAAEQLGRRTRAAQVDGPGDRRLAVVPLRAGRPARRVGAVVVEISLAPFHSLKREVLGGSIVLGLVVLLGAALAIDRALRGALDPVHAMTTSAGQWSEHDLDRRFALPAARDEIGELAATLDRLLERIAASRRHERRFAGDVAHELRNPLAVIGGRAEFGADERSSARQRLDALRAIGREAARMSATVDTLLAVARHEIDPQGATADLNALVMEIDDVELELPDGDVRVEGDPEIIHRALAPLIDNARRHARSQVTLELRRAGARAQLRVRDDGPGLEPGRRDALLDVGDREPGRSGGRQGLGLALARRLARACGGDVAIGDGPGGCFVLELPLVGERGDAERAGRPE